MTRVLFVAAGEGDRDVLNYHYCGFGRELIPLSRDGRRQAEAAAADPRLQEASVILTSPYTRAMETAVVIMQATGLPVKVEFGLHDWIPKDPYDSSSDSQYLPAYNTFLAYSGGRDLLHRYRYEIIPAMQDRIGHALSPYIGKEGTIIVVSHPIVAKVFSWDSSLENGGIAEFTI